jgi:hypothetical protein
MNSTQSFFSVPRTWLYEPTNGKQHINYSIAKVIKAAYQYLTSENEYSTNHYPNASFNDF